MSRLFYILFALAIVTPAAAENALEDAAPSSCPSDPRPGNYWIQCSASCPAGLLIGGSCNAGDTRGSAIAVESAGFVGKEFVCRYVDTTKIATGRTLDPNLKVSVTPTCLRVF